LGEQGSRLVPANVLRASDECAQRLEVAGEQPSSARLDEDVAERRRLDGPGEHG
jgi:hypothetical protein